MVLDELASGQLVEIMEQHTSGYGGIYAVYPNTRYLSHNVRTFIGYLVEFFRVERPPA
jgi:DNA-binding transcriptional LysR family regulator